MTPPSTFTMLEAALDSLPDRLFGRGCAKPIMQLLIRGIAESTNMAYQIRVQAIADAVGVRKGSARDAIRRLEQRGVIAIEPRSGTLRTYTDATEVASLYYPGQVFEEAVVGFVQSCFEDEDLAEQQVEVPGGMQLGEWMDEWLDEFLSKQEASDQRREAYYARFTWVGCDGTCNCPDCTKRYE